MLSDKPAANPAIPAPQVLTPAQLATRWGKCRQTIYNMINDGELASFKVRNSRLISLVEIQRIESGK